MNEDSKWISIQTGPFNVLYLATALMLDIKILAGGPAPMSYQCVPSSICVALLSGQDLNYLEISSAYLGEDNQSAGRHTRWQSALNHL